MKTGKRYEEEFKREVIKLVKEQGKSMSSVSRDLGVSVSSISDWVNKCVETETGTIMTSSEILKLKKELADVKMERDILKKAMAIFTK